MFSLLSLSVSYRLILLRNMLAAIDRRRSFRGSRRSAVMHGLRGSLMPFFYVRAFEYVQLFRMLERMNAPEHGLKVLDLSSNKQAALLLEQCLGHKVELLCTGDIVPYEVEHYLRLRQSQPERCECVPALFDGRRLCFSENTFDVIYSISVLQTVEGNGDTEVLREIARMLKPGGLCLVTVPFDVRGSRQSYVRQTMYNRTFGGVPIFADRTYDTESLQERLLGPCSELALEHSVYFGDRRLIGTLNRVYDRGWWAPGATLPGLLFRECRTKNASNLVLQFRKRVTAEPEAQLARHGAIDGD